jgi:anti-sigma B factor antagonist
MMLAELSEPLLAVTWAQDDPDCAVLSLQGELELCTVRRLKLEGDRLVAAHVSRVVLDLTRVSFMDSAGMGAILSFYKRTRGTVDVCLVLRDGGCRTMLDRIQLTRYVPTFYTVEDALELAA